MVRPHVEDINCAGWGKRRSAVQGHQTCGLGFDRLLLLLPTARVGKVCTVCAACGRVRQLCGVCAYAPSEHAGGIGAGNRFGSYRPLAP